MRLLYIIAVVNVFLVSLVLPQVGYAYIDPGTGASFFSLFGTVLAIASAGLAGASAFIVRHYLKAKNAVKKIL
ncbi:MAG: hypothetical protein HQK98_12000 [Nitrospirae bacterium]|nr:hypothetical protein [Nitrospirota bacterium]